MNIHKFNYTNQEAAELLTISANTLRNSRSTGKLCGREAPPFIKMGRKIIYLKADLMQWLESFPKYNNTAEAELTLTEVA
ncbi:helix-turn-helix domain-containing protein [Pseudoalteromonas sp. SCSIO 43088]|uniref:helix-turn-helix domain-containing protein n=1 Tax=Pseudoalteromonas sp. SCSIO 43088 TaxID=2822846 RepID=UPI00202B14B5|nr:helix-turn-helix domain-containing protein [Pseudoalteromonas sp. SCSIO 43088]URQ87865.1 helix-turn-helix domain-containing protein [Pseudoalteromonas sp. SCSIO 43088]